MSTARERRFRSSRRYQRSRLGFLAKHPLCAQHQRQGQTVLASELDHIVPVHKAPERFWDRSNWQPLCSHCHNLKTIAERGPTRQDSKQRNDWHNLLGGKPKHRFIGRRIG